MLQVKKIYVDTKYKTVNSLSSSDFSIELANTILTPDNCVFYVSDVCIPHAWYTVEKDVNDKFYLQIENDNLTVDVVLTLDSENYTGASLAVEILTQLNKLVDYTNRFTITYDASRHDITIMSDFGYEFKVLTKNDISTKLNNSWTGFNYDSANPHDINTYMLRLIDGVSPLYTSTSFFTSPGLDLQPVRNIYISSTMGNYTTMGPRHGQSNIIKKIPVNANYNGMVFDGISSSNDFLDCSKQTLKTIQFRVENSKGDLINLHNQECSFSIIFDILNVNS